MASFDRYLIVDWSARSKPGAGADSIWYCLLSRSADGTLVHSNHNPRTRAHATSEIRQMLLESLCVKQRTLVGFDFAFGYPAGFASLLSLADHPPWGATWRELGRRIVDHDDNSNNRFQVASEFNGAISGANLPFWGCPSAKTCPTLSATKRAHGLIGEKRITDVGNMQPIWKLYGNGSVGSQALLGIPRVSALRFDPSLAAASCIWPFETGLQEPRSLIVYAEVYPSLLPCDPGAGEIKDMVQVRSLARYFAKLDESARLAELFRGSPALTAEQRQAVEQEEGWTLGVTAIGRPGRRRLRSSGR